MDVSVYFHGFLKYSPCFDLIDIDELMIGAESPVGTVPLGTYPNGRPYGLSFAGRYLEDQEVLSIMRLYEATFPARVVPRKLRWKRVNTYLPWALRYSH